MAGRARWAAGILTVLSLAAGPLAGTPAAAQAMAPASQAASAGGLKLHVDSAVETAQGQATTLALPGSGGDYVRVHAQGTAGVSTPDGRTLWQLSTAGLFRDWHLTLHHGDSPVQQDVQVPLVRISPSPFRMGPAEQDGVPDLHPVAAGYLAGNRVPVVAVADTAGQGVDPPSGFGSWPFSVPGSGLHYGTFVSVFNGRTGQMLYAQLDPGYVTQLAIANGELLVGDETGDPTSQAIGQWRSTSSLRALTFHPAGGGRLAARTAWTYSTGAPWAALFDLGLAGRDIALAWSDTPQDLGVPGPPDGHVVLLGPDGTVRWAVSTAGYPVLCQYDPSRGLLAVAAEQDPALAIGYTLTGLRAGDGTAAVSVRLPGQLPTALTAGDTGRNGRPGPWYAAGVVTTTALANGEDRFQYTAGRVDAVDPGTGRVLWSDTVKQPGNGIATGTQAPYPTALLPAGGPGEAAAGGKPGEEPGEAAGGAGGEVLVASGVGGGLTPTVARPYESMFSLRALGADDGHLVWSRSGGDVTDSLSVRLACTPEQPCVAGVTDQQDAISYDAGTGAVVSNAPLMGDLDAAVTARIGGQRVVIAGSQSGAVYALDAGDLSRVRWQADAGGAVHQIALASPAPGAAPVLVVAATNRVDVLDLATGRLRFARRYPGQFVWNVTVGRIGAHRAGVVVGTDALSAFDAGTGRTLWTYRPRVPAYFSDAAIVDGVAVAEYENQVAKGSSPPASAAPHVMAAVGVGPDGQVAWTAPGTKTTASAVLWKGVFASPNLAGGGATGVALDWTTTDGGGRVDVRDAVTGALLYSDSSKYLYGQMGWTVDPRLGVIALAEDGVVIEPHQAVLINSLTADSAAVVGPADNPVLLSTFAWLDAYPAATLPSLRAGPVASSYRFTPGALVPVGPAGGGQVVTLPQDLIAYQTISNGEEGQSGYPLSTTTEDGIALLTVTGTPPAAAGPRHRAAPPGSRSPHTISPHTISPHTMATVSPPAPRPGVGLATPQFVLKARGYTTSGHPVLAQSSPAGYDPATVGGYLHLTGDGAGQTVAIVDAYADPDITADVNTFSRQFGLPRVCGTAGAGPSCFDFTTSSPQGKPEEDPDWALETSLDVEWVHAIAPQAAVRLVQARSQTFADLFAAVSSAAALNPDVISMSWGTQEFSGESYYDGHCVLAHTVCVAASGDDGYPGSYPAYDPDVIAVGGTTLDLTSTGSVSSEQTWSGSGGGQSYFEAKPAAQHGVTPGGRRGTPDVSFDADPGTGVAVYDSVPFEGYAGWFVVGGTSLGAPSWAAILGGADQLRAAAGEPRLVALGGGAQRAIYALSRGVARVTSGPPNGLCPVECQPGAGYDFVTGLGSPRAGIDRALADVP